MYVSFVSFQFLGSLLFILLHSCFNTLMQGFARCCQDPVMHERITKEVKQWIWSTAKGVRNTEGCTDKHYPVPSLGKYQLIENGQMTNYN